MADKVVKELYPVDFTNFKDDELKKMFDSSHWYIKYHFEDNNNAVGGGQ